MGSTTLRGNALFFATTLLLISSLDFQALAYNRVQRVHSPWEGRPQSHVGNSDGRISVVTGPIGSQVTVDSDEIFGRGLDSLDPLQHHVDFDDLFPGMDQDAVETRSRVGESSEESMEQHRQPLFGGDDIVVPNFAQMFAEGPQIGQVRRPTYQLNMQQPWWNIFGVNSGEPWWKGSNVCIKRDEEDEHETNGTQVTSSDVLSESASGQPEFHMQFSACDDQDTKYSCVTKLFGPNVTRTVTTEYECCHGYSLDNTKTGCKRGVYENIATTIEAIGGKEFLRLARNVGLESKLVNDNLTVFVPSDEAILSFMHSNELESNSIEFIPELVRRRRSILKHRSTEPAGGRNVRRRPDLRQDGGMGEYEMSVEQGVLDINMEDPNDWKRNALDQQESLQRNALRYGHEDTDRTELQQTLLSQMIQGKLSTDDFVDEKVLYSENKDSVIRLNTWNVGSEKVKTVNCAKLVSINHKCTNGMVHLVDKMVKPVTQSIGQVVSSRRELSTLKSLLSTSGLMTMLENPKEHLTLFAPTNSAIDKIGHSLLFKMRNGDPCLKRILRHHILPITFCSSILYLKGQLRNVDLDLLDIERNADDKLFINGSQIITKDIVTTNGVIHIIDAVIMSENDQPLTKALENAGLTTFLNYIEKAGLTGMLNGINNVTVFAPTNEAFSSIPSEVLSNPDKLRKLLMYHLAEPETRACHFSHKQIVPSKLANKSIKINLFSNFPLQIDAQVTAQCARLTKVNNVACNGIIHEVDKVLLPPDHNLVDLLQTQPDLTIFLRLLAENEDLRQSLADPNQSHTILAPTNAAFFNLPREQFESILSQRGSAEDILKRHISSEPLCCAGVLPNLWFMTKTVETLGHGPIPVYRDSNGDVVYGNGKVTTCDLTASNGILHIVNTVLTTETAMSRSDRMGSCLSDALANPMNMQLFLRL